MNIVELRRDYHRRIFREIVRISNNKGLEYPNFADSGNASSMAIARNIVANIGHELGTEIIRGQTSGGRFEEITRDFLQESFDLLTHIRPGKWVYLTHQLISQFDQYQHLANLERIISGNKELASSLGSDYIVKPDIVIGRMLVSDDEINRSQNVLGGASIAEVASLTSIRSANSQFNRPLLHASISCKWTIRSDRSQNARTEALNLIRNRKGHLPHIMTVTAEPLPTRLAAIALGTGDLDCVYHFALPELKAAIAQINNVDQMEMLSMLIEGRRLRDISDLPFDLAI